MRVLAKPLIADDGLAYFFEDGRIVLVDKFIDA
jgi:hypothetical protein